MLSTAELKLISSESRVHCSVETSLSKVQSALLWHCDQRALGHRPSAIPNDSSPPISF